jgi:histidine triad (HIT) family protein
MKDCIFCRIVRGEIPSKKIYESDKVFCFADIQPQAKHHYLVIPKTHIESLAHLDEQNKGIVQELFDVGIKISEDKGFKNVGFRSVINTGKDGGQTVFHLHLHILSGPKMKAQFGQENE